MTCELLGGKFPLPRSQVDMQNLRLAVGYTNDYAAQCLNNFFMPIVQKPGCNPKRQDCLWVEDFKGTQKLATFLPWLPSQPNGGLVQQCVTLDLGSGLGEYYDSNCDSVYCSLCQFERSVQFTLRGLHESSRIDRNYIFVPQNQNSGMLTFNGHRTTQINWFHETNQWRILDFSFKPPILGYYNLSTPKVIVGRFQWSLTNYWDPNDDTPELRDLKLSRVFIVILNLL